MPGVEHEQKAGPPAANLDLPPVAAGLGTRIERLVEQLGEGLLERDEAIRLCLLAALTGESIFLLGLPGVAKSLIARRLKHVFPPEAKAFEYLMNRFSTPDEIFGPISIRSLKSDDELVRKTELYLPGATVVFLDEIWKAGPSIQNTLLTAINERVFRNAGQDEAVKLEVLISASNELPAPGEGLGALWDRFLIRLVVENVKQPESRHKLICGIPAAKKIDIAPEDRFDESALKVIRRSIESITIPRAVLLVVDEIVSRIVLYNNDRSVPEDKNKEDPEHASTRLYVSDRRWKKIGRLMRACALCNGRTTVDLIDCFLARYCIWEERSQIDDVDRMILRAVEAVVETRCLESMRADWQSIVSGFDQLPSTTYRPPMPFRNFYKIDLSENRERLSDGKRVFGRLPKTSHARLGRRFKRVELAENDSGERVALEGKQGATPAEIRLKNDRGNGPLASFEDTAFRLVAGKGVARFVSWSDRRATSYRAEVAEFRKQVVAYKGEVKKDRIGLGRSSESNLFVSLSTESLGRLTDAFEKLERKLVDLGSEVAEFQREKGLI